MNLDTQGTINKINLKRNINLQPRTVQTIYRVPRTHLKSSNNYSRL